MMISHLNSVKIIIAQQRRFLVLPSSQFDSRFDFGSLPIPRSLPHIHIWTHWGRVTHICVSKLNIICSDHGLSSGRRQAIIWTNAGILLIGPLGANFIEILIEILTFSFAKMRLKVSSAQRWPSCLDHNVLTVNKAYTIHSIHCSMCYVITHPCLNFRGG